MARAELQPRTQRNGILEESGQPRNPASSPQRPENGHGMVGLLSRKSGCAVSVSKIEALLNGILHSIQIIGRDFFCKDSNGGLSG